MCVCRTHAHALSLECGLPTVHVKRRARPLCAATALRVLPRADVASPASSLYRAASQLQPATPPRCFQLPALLFFFSLLTSLSLLWISSVWLAWSVLPQIESHFLSPALHQLFRMSVLVSFSGLCNTHCACTLPGY